MLSAGKSAPSYKNAAHHMIMSNTKDPRMIELRTKMEGLGIKINSSENGVFLPTSTKVQQEAATSAIPHSRVHTDRYKQNVYDRLKDINNKADFENELNKISSELSNGTFGY